MTKPFIAVLGMSGLVAVLLLRPGGHDGASAVVGGPADRALEAEVGALRHEVSALRAQVATLTSLQRQASQAPTVPVPAAQPEAELSAAEQQVAAQELRKETLDTFEEVLAKEQVDRAWATTVAGQVRETLASNAPATRLLESSCAATLCRIVVAHESLDQQREVGMLLGTSEPFRHGVFYDHDSEANPPRSTLYVMREGHSFPSAPTAL